MVTLMSVGIIIVNLLGPTVLQKIQPKSEQYTALLKTFQEKPESLVFYIDQNGDYWVEGIYEGKKIVYVFTASDLEKIVLGVPLAHVAGANFRPLHLLNQAILGLTVYSWALPVTLNLSDPTISAAIGLSTPLIWFGLNISMSSNETITPGTAYAGLLGGVEGLFHGWRLFNSPRGIFPLSLAENLFDQYLSRKLSLSPGIVQRKFNFVASGFYHTFVLSKLLDHPFHPSIGAAVSLLEGYSSLFLSKDADYLTLGDALFELRLSMLGAETGPLILLSLYPDSPLSLVLSTSVIGLSLTQFLGMQLSRKYDLSFTASALNFLLPYLAHGAVASIGLLLKSKTFWQFYPIVFLATDYYISWRIYQLFRKPSISRESSSLRVSPFIRVSEIPPRTTQFGITISTNW